MASIDATLLAVPRYELRVSVYECLQSLLCEHTRQREREMIICALGGLDGEDREDFEVEHADHAQTTITIVRSRQNVLNAIMITSIGIHRSIIVLVEHQMVQKHGACCHDIVFYSGYQDLTYMARGALILVKTSNDTVASCAYA